MPDTTEHPWQAALGKLWALVPWMLEAAIIAGLLLFNVALGPFEDHGASRPGCSHHHGARRRSRDGRGRGPFGGRDGPVCPPGPISEGVRPRTFAVFVGLLPEDKYELVRVVQEIGHTVGMCGDGANDGPAIRQASGSPFRRQPTSPSLWVLASSVADVLIASSLAILGLAMAPLPVRVVVCMLAAAAVFAFLLVVVKRPVSARLRIG